MIERRYKQSHKVRKSVKDLERKINHVRGKGHHHRWEIWAMIETVRKEIDILKKEIEMLEIKFHWTKTKGKQNKTNKQWKLWGRDSE